jgi:hypothetical protein
MRVYAKCMAGLEDVWIGRMNDALHLQDPQHNYGRRTADQDGGPGMRSVSPSSTATGRPALYPTDPR